MLELDEIIHITGGIPLARAGNFPVAWLTTDSRKAVFNEASLFFAIRGKYHDGHGFINDLYLKGIRQFVVENHDFEVKNYPGSNFIFVENSIIALQKIAAFHRKKYQLKIIGITGSNGKTIVKEWLSQLISWKSNVVKTPKSFNSQIGVPLSVWQINENHDIGIFEAGISSVNEMQNLQAILDPQIGIFTNIGTAHDEGFSSRDQKIAEKLKLFINTGVLVYCADFAEIDTRIKLTLKTTRLVTWGTGKSSNFRITFPGDRKSHVLIKNTETGDEFHFDIPFSDQASVENLMHCIILLLYLEWEPKLIQDAINSLGRISMRLELKRGINDCILIDDSYNNDLISLEIGLNFMMNQGNKEKKTLILSDILQTGLPDEVLYKKTAELVKQYKINKLIGIGNSIKSIQQNYTDEYFNYPDVKSFLTKHDLASFNNEIILIKGARIFSLEKITAAFQEKIHGTVLEIDLDAIFQNFNYFRGLLKPGTKIMVMVKALAYGSGSLEIANLMQYHRADYLGVAYADEGVFLRKNGIGMPIMVMNPTEDSFEKLLTFRLEPEIYNLSLLENLVRFLKARKSTMNIHLKIDTGMHRLGIEKSQIPGIIKLLKSSGRIRLKSLFSHFAAADDPTFDEFTQNQAESFLDMAGQIVKELGEPVMKHIANSAAIIRFTQYHFDMVRLGIGLYGMDPGTEASGNLKTVSTFKTLISQIRHVKSGESVGYGRKGKVIKDSKIATIAVGYADGFSRAFSNGVGKVWVNGVLAPVIGNVCMDMTMIDVTGIDAREGDEVIVFGKEHSISDLARSIHTIPYEILTGISERVKRVYYKE